MSTTAKRDARTIYVTRAEILELLSDSEVATVGTAETARRLAEGDEFLDLTALDRGVRKVDGDSISTPLGHVLPRKAVHADTWAKILAHLRAVGPSA